MKTPSRWLRFLAFINWPHARRRLGGMRAARTRKERLQGAVSSKAVPHELSVQAEVQK